MEAEHRFEVTREEAGRRLDVFLAERLGLSRAQTRRLLARGAVRVAGRSAQAKGLALRAGEQVEVEDAAARESWHVEPEPDAPLVVLARGPGWLALDKPAGVAVHPLGPGERGTLLGAVGARHPEIDGVGEGGLRSGVVHRLDVDTSGAVLMALEEAAWQRLRAAFREHRVEKVYRAIALGEPPETGDLELPLVVARHRPAFVRAADDSERDAVRPTRTRWRVLERLRGASLLEVRITTGFLHQVRATLAHLGHPLAGDRGYAGDVPDASGARRHMLHASRVALEEIEATSPDPEDFTAVLERLRP